MSHDNITNFIGGTPLEPPECDCSEFGGCFFGLECSELTAVLTSFCWENTPSGVAIVSTQETVLVLTFNAELSASGEAIYWTYITGEHVSTISYSEQCGWQATFHCQHVALCPNDCPNTNPNWVTYTPNCFCEERPSPCECIVCGEAFAKDIPEFIGDDEIAEALGCDPHESNVGLKVVDVSLSTPCKNTNMACTGFRAYTAFCVASP